MLRRVQQRTCSDVRAYPRILQSSTQFKKTETSLENTGCLPREFALTESEREGSPRQNTRHSRRRTATHGNLEACHLHSGPLISTLTTSSATNRNGCLSQEIAHDGRKCFSTARLKQQAQQARQASEEDQEDADAATVKDDGLVGDHQETTDSTIDTIKIRSIDIKIDPRVINPMVEALQNARKSGLPDNVQPYTVSIRPPESRLWQENPEYLKQLSADLAETWAKDRAYIPPKFAALLSARERLPVMAQSCQKAILESLQNNDVLIIRASTGSGKTTQVPQIILDNELKNGRGGQCNIVITQPRRISATSVARRVATERYESVGESVGYHVRFSIVSPRRRKGNMVFCTAGVLLRSLQKDSEHINKYSHMIVDELHERGSVVDCTLTLLRQYISERKASQLPYPKIILMSATLESNLFREFFEQSTNGVNMQVAELKVDGTLFPVQQQYLPELLSDMAKLTERDPMVSSWLNSSRKADATRKYLKEELRFEIAPQEPLAPVHSSKDDQSQQESDIDEGDGDESTSEGAALEEMTTDVTVAPTGLVAASVIHVLESSEQGDILVFLVGIADIEKTAELLRRHPRFALAEPDELRLFKLHGSLTDTNDNVFDPVPPGCRRIVLATNIAETSITLPEVEHVIDLGKVRQRIYDTHARTDTYPSLWISKSSRIQREGRAGRVRPGRYYALFSRKRLETFALNASPEITRSDLTETCLDLKASPVADWTRDFLMAMPTPPSVQAVDHAVAYLKHIGALTEHEELSALGRLLASVPVHPSLTKAALLGLLFQCFEPMLIVASQDIESTLVGSELAKTKANDSRRAFAGGSESDVIAHIKAFQAYDLAQRNADTVKLRLLEQEHHIRREEYNEMCRVARQICEKLTHAGLLPPLDSSQSVFASMPAVLNRNADCLPLVKALSMNLFSSDVALRKGKSKVRFLTWSDTNVMVEPRSVNFGSRRKDPQKVYKRDEMLAYISRRQDVEDLNLSWLSQTSIVTPLIASVFGRSLDPTDDGLLLNEFVAAHVGVTQADMNSTMAKKVIVEFRKAFERFCTLAFIDLDEAAKAADQRQKLRIRSTAVYDGTSTSRDQWRPTKHNVIVTRQLRETFVKGILDVLKADDEVMQEIRQKDAEEFAIKQEEEKQEQRRKASARRRLQEAQGAELQAEVA